ncbi:MAG: hypothetical protein UT34_C0002G0219 [candidate division WS6 bacterium GW2011_GWF2_39_15]|uniref:Uncharacterized protein n=1 Tax=candidate division WS6 bacterium GW2011_GWF2_39_15 TaxID=1619100 RepID=A0A0G0QVS0_9BACT|nr:MAG: hypothetical protein UT34_C0002G0219 [candidate division WS6 bacterium GW2011_GWF2_39_15]
MINNPIELLQMHTLLEIFSFILTITLFTAIMFGYNTYIIKRRPGRFLLIIVLPPILLSLLAYIVSPLIGVSIKGINVVPVLWMPVLLTLLHTEYFIDMLKKTKTDTANPTFEFPKKIVRETIYFIIAGIIVTASCYVLFPQSNLIPFILGLVISAISVEINTVIINKRL